MMRFQIMRFKTHVNGLKQDINTMTMKKCKFIIHYTHDAIGETLSIGDPETGIQYSISFDGIHKLIRGK